TVNKLATSTSLASSRNPSVSGQAVTFTANVMGGAGTPTGSVEFFDYARSLGVIGLSAGSASLTTAGLAAGSHSIRAVYNSDAKYLGSTSPTLIQTVAAVTPVGSNISVQETAGLTMIAITFAGVTVPGTTTITPIDPASAGTMPGGFSVGGLAFDISTTASFVGPVTVCFQVPSVTDPVAFSKLRILHSAPKLDLATANSTGNNVSILLQTNSGGFGGTANPAVGSGPVSLSTGDFNGDGKADLAVLNYSSGTVTILLGNGTGGFSAVSSLGVGLSATSVAVGDFNGDGKLDLAAANGDYDFVSIYLGNGTGGFNFRMTCGVGNHPQSATIGDFNADGRLDLAVVNRYSNNVSILLGNGDGGFGPATNFSVGGGPTGLAVGDFNGDGKLDLAVTNYGVNTVSILQGNGTGGFGAATIFTVGTSPKSIAVGDFNDDGKLDL